MNLQLILSPLLKHSFLPYLHKLENDDEIIMLCDYIQDLIDYVRGVDNEVINPDKSDITEWMEYEENERTDA